MKGKFHVEVLRFSVLEQLEGIWTDKEYADLLAEMEFGSTDGLSSTELQEMCLLSLQELEPDAAAALVLEYHFGDRLSAGQIQNISVEMLDEKLWEEYADMALQEDLFNVSSLLYSVSPNVFPEPDAVLAEVSVTALNEGAREILRNGINESFLLRLLASGMDEDIALARLFQEQLAGNAFPEAEFIIWKLSCQSQNEEYSTVEVISSGAWLDALRDTKSYSAFAWPDKVTTSAP